MKKLPLYLLLTISFLFTNCKSDRVNVYDNTGSPEDDGFIGSNGIAGNGEPFLGPEIKTGAEWNDLEKD